MVLDKKLIKRAYTPYLIDAKRCIPNTCLVVSMAILGTFLFIEKGKIPFLYICLMYLLAILFLVFDFYTLFLIALERKRSSIFEHLTLVGIKAEETMSSFMKKGENAHKCEGEEMLTRYRLVFKNATEQRLVFRTMMSKRKANLFFERLMLAPPLLLTVHCMKLSKIVVYYEGEDDLCDLLNHLL